MSQQLPLGELRYLYVGSGRFDDDLAYYRDVVGADKVWHFHRFGARVAGFRVAAGPIFIIADHRPAPSCLPVFAVDDIEATVRDLRARGWQPESGPFEVPDGPCYLFRDPSGNQIALVGSEQPNRLAKAYADPDDPNAVR